jgi:glycerophosphoryl diester phosphodiesterase
VPGTKRHVLRIVAAAAFVSALPAVMTAAKAAKAAEAAGPLVIAHRGASSYLPEQTQACFVLAHAQGADYIEIDVASTRVGILICVHDPYLETTTDVAD